MVWDSQGYYWDNHVCIRFDILDNTRGLHHLVYCVDDVDLSRSDRLAHGQFCRQVEERGQVLI
ncbi:MAG: hypothetical protein QGD92_15380 [Gammaproteobacteria bacterium]|nr:hypothetical protein [Gammaproteobacteria bacterium]